MEKSKEKAIEIVVLYYSLIAGIPNDYSLSIYADLEVLKKAKEAAIISSNQALEYIDMTAKHERDFIYSVIYQIELL